MANTEVVFGVEPNSLFALLGHNGAGKSTLFNQLTGLLAPTSGDAFVFGKSIKEEMDEIRAMMGVCPQHDILWDDLTAAEHLRLFAQLKNVDTAGVNDEVDARLSDVGLERQRDVMAGAYSGGMRRRLSTAIAFTGNPRIVFLDEPTTGMDPVTRRQVWNLIQRKKQDRIIVLTTHSMEEADVLSDRIGILSRGRISTIGTARYLKARYGTGTKLTIIPKSKNDRGGITEFVYSHLNGLDPVTTDNEERGGDVIYVVPETMHHLLNSPVLPSISNRDHNSCCIQAGIYVTGLVLGKRATHLCYPP